ncbi:MAG: hypothetical protein IJL52_01770 [Clostridia bacterium]|nr:hypothetical protein [Clostridia bacterium]
MTVELPSLTLRFRFSFFAVLTVMLLLCSARVTLLCVLASLLHECGHLLAMALVKCPPRCVTFGAGGIVIDRGDRFAGRGAECFFALGGIGMNLLLAAASFLRYRMTRAPWAMLFFWANMLPAAVNALPVRGLDVWTALCARFGPRRGFHVLSDVTTALLCTATVLYFIKISVNPSLAVGCVYCILLNGSAGNGAFYDQQGRASHPAACAKARPLHRRRAEQRGQG